MPTIGKDLLVSWVNKVRVTIQLKKCQRPGFSAFINNFQMIQQTNLTALQLHGKVDA